MSTSNDEQPLAPLAAITTTTTVVVPGRGRGRVVPRKGAGIATAATATALVPMAGPSPPDAAAERALALGQAPWRARRSLRSGGSVPRYSSVASAAAGALRRGEPAVLAGLRLSALRLGGGASSSSAANTAATPGVTILTSAPGVDRFFELDAAKNADPRGYYHVAHTETTTTTTNSTTAGGDKEPGGSSGGRATTAAPATLSLGEWLRRASSWTETRTLCRALLGAWEVQEGATTTTTTTAAAPIRFYPNAPALREASRALSPAAAAAAAATAARPGGRPSAAPLRPSDLLDWPRALELLRAVSASAGGDDQGEGGELWLEACNPGRSAGAAAAAATAVLLPMRALPHARVLVQVSGHRRVVLVDPSFTYGDGQRSLGMRPFPFAHPLEGYSSRGWEEGDGDDEEALWLAAGDGGGGGGPQPVHGRVAELAPGDALVIPAHWWAHQELLPPPPPQRPGEQQLHAALELRLPAPSASAACSSAASGAALRAQAARLAEGVLAASLGAPAVARCLEALARGGGPGERQQQQQQQHDERQPPLPPSSVRAYDRAVACGEAFEMLVAACLAAPPEGAPAPKGPVGRLLRAEAEARALCAAMAAGGRLRGHAGGALAAVGAAAGLEAPRRWLIEEDAEAARFPSLFRHRLLGAREDWRRHAVPLLLLEGGLASASASAASAALLPPAGDARAAR